MFRFSTKTARITTICYVLRIVSTEFQASRLEAHHWRIRNKSPDPASHLQNLPNSVKRILLYKTHKATIEVLN